MTCFALAHMSCAGAWAWGAVPDRLRAAGHRVVAPDLPLHAGVTPMAHAELLAAAVVLCVLVAADRRSVGWAVAAGVYAGLAILGNVRLSALPLVLAAYLLVRLLLYTSDAADDLLW